LFPLAKSSFQTRTNQEQTTVQRQIRKEKIDVERLGNSDNVVISDNVSKQSNEAVGAPSTDSQKIQGEAPKAAPPSTDLNPPARRRRSRNLFLVRSLTAVDIPGTLQRETIAVRKHTGPFHEPNAPSGHVGSSFLAGREFWKRFTVPNAAGRSTRNQTEKAAEDCPVQTWWKNVSALNGRSSSAAFDLPVATMCDYSICPLRRGCMLCLHNEKEGGTRQGLTLETSAS
jgi:hypothetical protein